MQNANVPPSCLTRLAELRRAAEQVGADRLVSSIDASFRVSEAIEHDLSEKLISPKDANKFRKQRDRLLREVITERYTVDQLPGGGSRYLVRDHSQQGQAQLASPVYLAKRRAMQDWQRKANVLIERRRRDESI